MVEAWDNMMHRVNGIVHSGTGGPWGYYKLGTLYQNIGDCTGLQGVHGDSAVPTDSVC